MPGFVFLRVRAHRLLLAAAVLTVLLTTAVLAALTAFSTTIGDAGLRHVLRYGSAVDAALVVKTPTLPQSRAATADNAVRKQAARAYDGLPVAVQPLLRSGPYALPDTLRPAGAGTGEDPDLTYFAQLDRTQVELVDGAWPKAGGEARQAALPESAARALRLGPGDEFALTGRSKEDKPVTVRLSGVYRPKDLDAPYWQLDDAGGRGVRTLGYTTYGPLMADPADFAAGRLRTAAGGWVLRADFSHVTADRIDALTDSVKAATETLPDIEALGPATATTHLPDVLETADRALLVNRSTLLIVALQLILLAGYALLLVARLLSDERAGENALLRARGGSRGRVAGLAATEALLLVLPAAIVAPLLAGPMIGLLSGTGPLERAGVEAATSLTRTTWLVGVGAALGCALAVTAPALLRAAGDRTLAVGRARAKPLPAPLRAGADLGLLVVAGVAYWQLDRQTSGGGALNTDTSGTLGVDPVLVAAPALALLAGTVLTLRLLPPTARLAERRAASGRGLPAALAGWQLSRRPLRGAGPVLLLVLAVAMGMLAIAQGASWERSQRDQAAFRAGTDIRVLSTSLSALGQGGVYANAPGVEQASPATRMSMPLAEGRSADILALDTATAAEGIRLRGDLADGPAEEKLAALERRPAKTVGLTLPKGTERLEMTLRITSDPEPQRLGALPGMTDPVTVRLEDRYGLPYEVYAGELPVDGRDHTVTLDLAKAAGAGGKPAEPLLVTGFDFDFTIFDRNSNRDVTMSAITAVTGGKRTGVTVPRTLEWEVSESADGNVIDKTPRSGLPVEGDTGTPLRFNHSTGTAPYGGYGARATGGMTVRAEQPPAPDLGAIATDQFLTSTGLKVGDVLNVSFGGTDIQAKIVDTLRELPTTGPGSISRLGPVTPAQDGGALLVDFRTASRQIVRADGNPLRPTEWWLRTAPGQTEKTVTYLRGRGDSDPSDIIARDELTEQLSSDPLGAGPQAALTATAVVAALLAAMGFAVSAAASIRERTNEFAVLRALGAPQRQLARMFAAEQSVLIGLALAAGLVLGAVLSRTVVPLTTLTASAAKPHPPVLVELPWTSVGLVIAGVAAVPLLITAAVALRRGDPATALRLGGE
ncbi:hypothetical protein SRB5_52520 [Streptomyces sp. RB5]|uniref:ABC3 transporter permease C-terminal domain-containing protein n=1 Tax=Streptomyces smaragdinus TaxID=2585196 RepID=A0A7K0CQP3_9ACTN|nr:ABC transporter permease [Streptomyces smaragdinus]MQY15074.1 hypothetical protein [Streptomyces smaragdinus]